MPSSHPRPLSPHLQIYRPQWTTVLSILHRITGVGLTLGLVPLTWFLYALAAGPEAFAGFLRCAGSPLGQIMLLGWSFALSYHACAGVRHLVFDTGHLLHAKHAEMAGKIVLAAAVLCTAALWVYVRG